MRPNPTAPTSAPPLPATSFEALLQLVARKKPDQAVLSWQDPALPVVDDPWRELTGHALQARVAQAASALSGMHQIQPGQRVAWLGLNHPALIVLLFALARLGAVLVPLNHRLSPAEWASVLADCTPTLLVHDACFGAEALALSRASREAPRSLELDALFQARAAEPGALDAPPNADSAHKPLLLVYTSGTTGLPKGAVHTQAHLLANMAIAASVQSLTDTDTVLTVLPLFHVGGLCIQTLPALSVGARVLLHARFDAGATLDCIQAERPTLTLQVPATLQALIAHPNWSATNLSSLRALWAGSSVLPSKLLDAVHERGLPVCNVYGSTETGPFSIALPPEHALTHVGSCGWTAPGVEVVLRDAQGTPVDAGQVGEISVRAPNVVTHYWPARPAQDEQGFFHTGDLARQAADGSFTVVGRAKDMIISGGENIYPAEIENLLSQHPDVLECAVVGQADARWGEVVVAAIVWRDPRATEGWQEALQTYLDGRLARYKWPRRWHRLEALPRTALGKVQKPVLKSLLGV
jgi:fatty-acyl-CoA synthase